LSVHEQMLVLAVSIEDRGDTYYTVCRRVATCEHVHLECEQLAMVCVCVCVDASSNGGKVERNTS
jgi:hypothetical protein